MKKVKVLSIILLLSIVFAGCSRKTSEIENNSVTSVCTKAEEQEKITRDNIEHRFGKYNTYTTDDITCELLENRTDYDFTVVEVVVAIVDHDLSAYYGDNYYINYRSVSDVQPGDIVKTFLVYNSENNYIDDIVERYDIILN